MLHKLSILYSQVLNGSCYINFPLQHFFNLIRLLSFCNCHIKEQSLNIVKERVCVAFFLNFVWIIIKFWIQWLYLASCGRVCIIFLECICFENKKQKSGNKNTKTIKDRRHLKMIAEWSFVIEVNFKLQDPCYTWESSHINRHKLAQLWSRFLYFGIRLN